MNYRRTKSLTSIPGLLPFLGYHHILMILIALAIILLCTLYLTTIRHPPFHRLTMCSPLTSRMFILITTDTEHIPNITVLPNATSHIRFGAGRPRSNQRNRKHRRKSHHGSPSRLFRNLHKPHRWQLPLQQQRKRSSRPTLDRSRPTEPHLGSQYLQRQHRIPLPNVSPHPHPT